MQCFSFRNAEYVPSVCYTWISFLTNADYAINNKLTPFISMQNHYNLIYREEEREMFPTLNVCVLIYPFMPALIVASQWFDVASIPWSPIARGLLCRPLNEATKRTRTDPYLKGYTTNSPPTQEIIKRVEEIAKAKGISMAQLSLAWVLSKPGEFIMDSQASWAP